MSASSVLAPQWFMTRLPPWRVRQIKAQRDFAMRRARWLKSVGEPYGYEVRIARDCTHKLVRNA